MNAIGFLKIYDSHIECSKEFDDLFSNKLIDPVTLEEVVSYLRNGISTIKYISDIYDTDGEIIGPNIIYTDGVWIWPSYYTFYINKYPQLLIPDDLIQHVIANRHHPINVSKEEKMYIEYMIAKMLDEKLIKDYKLSNEIRDLINKRGEVINCY